MNNFPYPKIFFLSTIIILGLISPSLANAFSDCYIIDSSGKKVNFEFLCGSLISRDDDVTQPPPAQPETVPTLPQENRQEQTIENDLFPTTTPRRNVPFLEAMPD